VTREYEAVYVFDSTLEDAAINEKVKEESRFVEALTNEILDELSAESKPKWMKITSKFTPRGGITTEVVAEYKK